MHRVRHNLRGEIATTLTLISLGVMLVGLAAGSQRVVQDAALRMLGQAQSRPLSQPVKCDDGGCTIEGLQFTAAASRGPGQKIFKARSLCYDVPIDSGSYFFVEVAKKGAAGPPLGRVVRPITNSNQAKCTGGTALSFSGLTETYTGSCTDLEFRAGLQKGRAGGAYYNQTVAIPDEAMEEICSTGPQVRTFSVRGTVNIINADLPAGTQLKVEVCSVDLNGRINCATPVANKEISRTTVGAESYNFDNVSVVGDTVGVRIVPSRTLPSRSEIIATGCTPRSHECVKNIPDTRPVEQDFQVAVVLPDPDATAAPTLGPTSPALPTAQATITPEPTVYPPPGQGPGRPPPPDRLTTVQGYIFVSSSNPLSPQNINEILLDRCGTTQEQHPSCLSIAKGIAGQINSIWLDDDNPNDNTVRFRYKIGSAVVTRIVDGTQITEEVWLTPASSLLIARAKANLQDVGQQQSTERDVFVTGLPREDVNFTIDYSPNQQPLPRCYYRTTVKVVDPNGRGINSPLLSYKTDNPVSTPVGFDSNGGSTFSSCDTDANCNLEPNPAGQNRYGPYQQRANGTWPSFFWLLQNEDPTLKIVENRSRDCAIDPQTGQITSNCSQPVISRVGNGPPSVITGRFPGLPIACNRFVEGTWVLDQVPPDERPTGNLEIHVAFYEDSNNPPACDRRTVEDSVNRGDKKWRHFIAPFTAAIKGPIAKSSDTPVSADPRGRSLRLFTDLPIGTYEIDIDGPRFSYVDRATNCPPSTEIRQGETTKLSLVLKEDKDFDTGTETTCSACQAKGGTCGPNVGPGSGVVCVKEKKPAGGTGCEDAGGYCKTGGGGCNSDTETEVGNCFKDERGQFIKCCKAKETGRGGPQRPPDLGGITCQQANREAKKYNLGSTWCASSGQCTGSTNVQLPFAGCNETTGQVCCGKRKIADKCSDVGGICTSDPKGIKGRKCFAVDNPPSDLGCGRGGSCCLKPNGNLNLPLSCKGLGGTCSNRLLSGYNCRVLDDEECGSQYCCVRRAASSLTPTVAPTITLTPSTPPTGSTCRWLASCNANTCGGSNVCKNNAGGEFSKNLDFAGYCCTTTGRPPVAGCEQKTIFCEEKCGERMCVDLDGKPQRGAGFGYCCPDDRSPKKTPPRAGCVYEGSQCEGLDPDTECVTDQNVRWKCPKGPRRTTCGPPNIACGFLSCPGSEGLQCVARGSFAYCCPQGVTPPPLQPPREGCVNPGIQCNPLSCRGIENKECVGDGNVAWCCPRLTPIPCRCRPDIAGGSCSAGCSASKAGQACSIDAECQDRPAPFIASLDLTNSSSRTVEKVVISACDAQGNCQTQLQTSQVAPGELLSFSKTLGLESTQTYTLSCAIIFADGTTSYCPDQEIKPIGGSALEITATDDGVDAAATSFLQVADLNADGRVTATDIALLLRNSYGLEGDNVDGDINGDGRANALDLSLLLDMLDQSVE